MSIEHELKDRLESLRRQYKGISSMIEMMEKGTPSRDLARIRADKLAPISEEIKTLERQLSDITR